jgi:hypothetical protein
LIYNYKQKKDMPIVKQPSKLITASGHKSFQTRNCSFKLLLEENKARKIAKIMRFDEKNHRYPQATAA